MPRRRNVDPSLFTHEELYLAESATGLPLRLAYIGLWCVADRDGRFEWRPNRMKLDILPWDATDFGSILDQLVEVGMIRRYSVAGATYGDIPAFRKYQNIHPHEAKSKIPPHPDVMTCNDIGDQSQGMSIGISSLRNIKPSEQQTGFQPLGKLLLKSRAEIESKSRANGTGNEP